MDDARVEQEEGDAMAELENRTAESKNEMDILDALDEMRAQVGDMPRCAALCCAALRCCKQCCAGCGCDD